MSDLYRFIDDDHLECGNLKFNLCWSDFSRKTTPEEIVLLKPRQWVESYIELILKQDAKRVLELGIWQGGMAILLPLLRRDLGYVGVDFSAPIPGIEAIRSARPDIAKRTRLFFRTSQDDPTLPAKVTQLFKGQPLDLIMDDASHLYFPTIRAFENLFGLLRPGGRYVIEDWGWAHWPGYVIPEDWKSAPALSTMLFELNMLMSSTHGLIDRIEVERSKFTVFRGSSPLPNNWTIASLLNLNGFKFEPLKYATA